MLWTLASVLSLVILLVALIYVPFFQDYIKDIAIDKINSAQSGLHISLDKFRIRFPINLALDGLTVSDTAGDTMIHSEHIGIDIATLPLFTGRIDIREINIDRALYRLGSPDSAMFLMARIDRFAAGTISGPFSLNDLRIGKALLDGADITLNLRQDTTESQTETADNQMIISARAIDLRNVAFRMNMKGVIDSLDTKLPDTRIRKVKIDLGGHTVDVGSLSSSGLDATYLTPATPAQTEPSATSTDTLTSTATTTPWTICAGNIAIGGKATYAKSGTSPASGFDMNYIQLSDIELNVDSFYNRASEIRVPIVFTARERCGLSIHADGTFSMDSSMMNLRKFRIGTEKSELTADAILGTVNLTDNSGNPIKLHADGHIALSDLNTAFPSITATLRDLPSNAQILITSRIDGTSSILDIDALSLNIPGIARISADGHISTPFDFNRMNGQIRINGTVTEGQYLTAAMLPRTTAKSVSIPPATIKGLIDYSPRIIKGNIAMRTGQGRLAAKGNWVRNIDGYSADIDITQFPLASFLPSLELTDITINGTVSGHGFNPKSRSTSLNADIALDEAYYKGSRISGIRLKAALDTCRLDAVLISEIPDADLGITVNARFKPHGYSWDLSSDIRNLDLTALHISDSPLNGTLGLYSQGAYDTSSGNIDAGLNLSDVDFIVGEHRFSAPELILNITGTDTLSTASLNTGDLQADIHALCSIDTLITKSLNAVDTAMMQTHAKRIDIRPIQRTLPQFSFLLTTGADNIATRYIAATSGIKFDNATISLGNDSLLSAQAHVTGFSSGNIQIDNIAFNANQHNRFLVYNAKIDNNPGTMDAFAHVALAGYIAEDRLSAFFKQSDIHDRQGFFIGVNAQSSDSIVNIKFVPHKPTIAYKKWSINPDNFMTYNYVDRHLDANIRLLSDSSSLMLYTEHLPDTAKLRMQEDVILKLHNIKLSEWLSISPFAPPVKGVVGADMRFRWNNDGITGRGFVSLDELYYGRDRVGSFDLDLDISNDARTRALHADIALLVDSIKVITATGALNDSTARNPFLLDFSMIHFPLRVVNPFLPKSVAQLSGMLNGKMDITGTIAEPIFNGYLDFDSTAVKLGFTGASYRFSEANIPVDSNIVKFNDFTISGLNSNNLHVNGTVDARKFSDILLDLNMTARDMQLVNSSRPRGANLYGKAFIDLDATAKGSMHFLDVDASLDILPGTNVTYVMSDAESVLSSKKSDDMVRFVQFSDTTAYVEADTIAPPSVAMNLDANLTISEGSTINVDLSSNGKNKASVQANANLTYSQTPFNNGRLTGRLNIDKGFVRYSPPFMSEKNFSFNEGSYIAFNGDLLNPTLHLTAQERLKANVTQEGQNSRLVNFDIILSVTNTLRNMNVQFDLATNDDITIQNELSSMSPEQRANQAMNLLIYNIYTGPGTKASANLSGNPLFSFLESQINTWAANNIRGVDISFGIDQYDTTTDGTKGSTTSYSYRVSKSLFNDRFKIVVGGNYSTDADADENFSQNLINDIAFEYMLNRSGSMYVRLFRHVGYESILEGEITQTGVGFVLKRKINSLRDIFKFRSTHRSSNVTPRK